MTTPERKEPSPRLQDGVGVDLFEKWRPGLSPKELYDMVQSEQLLKWQAEQKRIADEREEKRTQLAAEREDKRTETDRKWHAEQKESDRKWQIEQTRNNREWQDSWNRGNRFWQVILALVAIASLVGTLLRYLLIPQR